MEREDRAVIDMLDQFGGDLHFNIAKSSAVVCIDEIIETIFKYGTAVEENKTERGVLFWNKVKLRVWQMKIKDYAKIKGMNY